MIEASLTILDSIILTLSPVERWQAARRLEGNEGGIPSWMIVGGLIAVITLAGLFVLLNFLKGRQQKSNSSNSFLELACQRGLSQREAKVLYYMAQQANLTNLEEIFTMDDAFAVGAKLLASKVASANAPDKYNKKVKAEVSALRSKLGFSKSKSRINPASIATYKPTSKEIPQDSILHISRGIFNGLEEIEARVIKNTDSELSVKLPEAIDCEPKEKWLIRYYFGATIWEFEVSVINNYEDVLVFSHSEDIRFVNRRRFLRVPVRKRAYIAYFPFARYVDSQDVGIGLTLKGAFDRDMVLPEFDEVIVTELAGPGLRIETKTELNVNDRIIVIFELEHIEEQDEQEGEANHKSQSRIVQDIGQVIHTRTIKGGFSVAVELTGLNDNDVNDLIRATNLAAADAVGNINDEREFSVEESTEKTPVHN